MKTMKNQAISILLALFLVLAVVPIASAVVVTSVSTPKIGPGEQVKLEVGLENILSTEVEDVTLNLDFKDLPFIPVGKSSAGFDQLDSDDSARAEFIIRASSDINPGDYQIPYTITFTQDGIEKTRKGSFGITVSAQPLLSYTISTETPIIGQEGKITLKIVNSGFAEAKFLSVKAIPSGFTILSEDQVYIGTVDSDDFETATFDVVFTSNSPIFSAIIDYTDFDNRKVVKAIDLPVTVYSEEKAVELGIIQKNNWPIYIGIAILVIILWFVWRAIAKRRRLKRSERS